MFDELTKAPHRIDLSSCRMRTLYPRGKMPQRFVMRLFTGFECADFERGPLLTFESATLCSLILIVLFREIEFASAAHFLVGVFQSFRARQNSLHHP